MIVCDLLSAYGCMVAFAAFDIDFYTDPTEARLLIDYVHGVDAPADEEEGD
jgi:hypothetical protein